MPAANSRGGSVASRSVSAKTAVGWWKAPTRFLPAADGAVDHREQGGRQLVESDAALVGGRGEAR